MNIIYTVTKKTDADLAGKLGRLIMQFEDGSCLEVKPEEVKVHPQSKSDAT